MGLPLQIEKTVYGIETHWLSGKGKVLGTAVNREGHADSNLEHEKTMTVNFLEKKVKL